MPQNCVNGRGSLGELTDPLAGFEGAASALMLMKVPLCFNLVLLVDYILGVVLESPWIWFDKWARTLTSTLFSDSRDLMSATNIMDQKNRKKLKILLLHPTRVWTLPMYISAFLIPIRPHRSSQLSTRNVTLRASQLLSQHHSSTRLYTRRRDQLPARAAIRLARLQKRRRFVDK